MNTLKDYVDWKLTHADKFAEAEGYPLTMENCKANKRMKELLVYGNSMQDGTPTPEVPIDVVSVGELVTDETDANYGKYKIPVVQRGKNIYNATTVLQSNRLTSKDTIKVKPNTNYVISVDNYTKSNPYWNIRGLNEPMTNISNPWQVGTQIMGMVNSFNSGKYEYIVIRQWYDIATNGVDANAQIQIEEGKTKSEFEPYIEPVTTNIFLNEPLRKIGDYADYIDFKHNKVIRNTFLRVYDGISDKNNPFNKSDSEENWAGKNIHSDKNENFWEHSLNDPLPIIPKYGHDTANDYKQVPICLQLPVKVGHYNSETSPPTVDKELIWFCQQARSVRLFLSKDRVDGNLTSFRNFLKSNPITVLIATYQPYEEPLNVDLPKLTAKTTIVEIDTSLTPSNAYGKYIKK